MSFDKSLAASGCTGAGRGALTKAELTEASLGALEWLAPSGTKHNAAAAAADALERGDQGRDGMKFVKVWKESRDVRVGDIEIIEDGEVGDREEGAGGEVGAKGSSVSERAWLFMTGDAEGA